ncbi:hypothetical protein JIN77_01985 [Verrucomicrobiaceae bacterium R5-34]|uniref:Uncharacterized protein n=1 Tax=Oceaniferula flava TaxID=2800421 RepID=A0AAE2VCU8_9BACT|nr:hypothetical protein [Oceaniferula flavus]MBK1829480.1 hypothetical protein [Verrucomicrobiaceae bacterium R5-34]MBK1853709.1 hypothetical protein [Oceaniferula flavus]MBM1135015.1 hypothetical protein [Oceaniferula flavus]
MINFFSTSLLTAATAVCVSIGSVHAQEVGQGAVAVDPLISNSARAAVQKLGIEMMKGNFQYSIDRMYPRWKRRLAVRNGGMVKLDAALAQSVQQQLNMQMKVVGYTVGHPTAFFSVWKAKKIDANTGKPVIDATGRERIVSHWLAVVPTVVRVKIPDPQRGNMIREIEESSYTIAISEKGSNDWHFMTGMKPSIQDLRSLFPSLPADEKALHLPPSKAREIK